MKMCTASVNNPVYDSFSNFASQQWQHWWKPNIKVNWDRGHPGYQREWLPSPTRWRWTGQDVQAPPRPRQAQVSHIQQTEDRLKRCVHTLHGCPGYEKKRAYMATANTNPDQVCMAMLIAQGKMPHSSRMSCLRIFEDEFAILKPWFNSISSLCSSQ